MARFTSSASLELVAHDAMMKCSAVLVPFFRSHAISRSFGGEVERFSFCNGGCVCVVIEEKALKTWIDSSLVRFLKSSLDCPRVECCHFSRHHYARLSPFAWCRISSHSPSLYLSPAAGNCLICPAGDRAHASFYDCILLLLPFASRSSL